MSSAKQGLPQVRAPTLPSKTTPEQRYWRSYINPQLIKENHPITNIEFNPATQDFAISSSTKIQIFSNKTRQVIKTFSRFKDTLNYINYRYDGKLIVASDASGLISIYDCAKPNNLLVSFKPSSFNTKVVKFHPNLGNQLITGSNDKTLRIFDISQTSQGPILEIKDQHDDYISSFDFINNNLLATGCYDGKIRLFDTRINPNNIITTFDQENPVEDVLCLTSNLLTSSGGSYVKVFDLNRMTTIHQLNNFTKSTTSLKKTFSSSTSNSSNGLMVGSLDGTVKIFDSSSINWKVQFGWKFGDGVLSCGVSPINQKHFVTGLTSGLITIRSKKTEKLDPSKPMVKSGGYARMMKGRDYTGDEEDHIIKNISSTTTSKKITGNVGDLMANYKKSLQIEDIKPNELNQQINEAKQAQEICGMLELLGV